MNEKDRASGGVGVHAPDAPTLTLPGDIPGLLRRGSPVRPVAVGAWHDLRSNLCSVKARSVVRAAPHPEYDSVYLCDWGNTPLGGVALDLSDPTGRAHAGWYADARIDAKDPDQPRVVANAVGCTLHALSVCIAWAMGNRDMTDDQIDTLRRVVLHVAGREVTP